MLADPAARYRPTAEPIEVIGLPLLDDDHPRLDSSVRESEMIHLTSVAILGDQLFLVLRNNRKECGWRSRIEVYDVTYDALAAIVVLTGCRRVELTEVGYADVIKLAACPLSDCVFALTQRRAGHR